jgi:hypothetical protein
MWQSLLPQTLIVQFLSNSCLFTAEGNQMSGLSAFDQLSSVHKENLNQTSKPNFSWSHIKQFPSELLFLYDMSWKIKFFNFAGSLYVHRIIIEVWSTQKRVVETMVVTDTMSGKWILVSLSPKQEIYWTSGNPSSNTKLNILTC